MSRYRAALIVHEGEIRLIIQQVRGVKCDGHTRDTRCGNAASPSSVGRRSVSTTEIISAAYLLGRHHPHVVRVMLRCRLMPCFGCPGMSGAACDDIVSQFRVMFRRNRCNQPLSASLSLSQPRSASLSLAQPRSAVL
jgi:hypothetical protein